MSDVADRYRKIVAAHLGLKPDEVASVTDQASFIDDLGADSLDTVELMMAAEEEFDIAIDDEDGQAVLTFGDAVKLIEAAIVKRRAA